ncbi:MAG: anhydro-N-acetylmuramic acid kinase [Planctomycetes bacterium]|nr:anhydro-N-acetylmuramic acid kinase [Planctomycetota bacterium]
MTGTSMDAIDAALIAVDGSGLAMRVSIIRHVSHPLGAMAADLREIAAQCPTPAGRFATLARDLALRHVSAIRDLVRRDPIDLIAIHGQTVFHAPPLSWQLIAPAPIAQSFGVPVVFDLRAADLAAGGEGAPITPLADFVMFADANETRAVVNLGGFANFSLLPGSRDSAEADPLESRVEMIRGGDICACNQLLDAVARRCFNEPFDDCGRHAGSGAVRADLCADLAGRLREQARHGRSLGTGDELGDWIDNHADRCSGRDLARTACEAIAAAIGAAVAQTSRDVGCEAVGAILVAGGGAKNAVLLTALREHCTAPVRLTDDFDVPLGHREAAAMGVLGALCQDRVAITLPHVTGVPRPAPIAGTWIHC